MRTTGTFTFSGPSSGTTDKGKKERGREPLLAADRQRIAHLFPTTAHAASGVRNRPRSVPLGGRPDCSSGARGRFRGPMPPAARRLATSRDDDGRPGIAGACCDGADQGHRSRETAERPAAGRRGIRNRPSPRHEGRFGLPSTETRRWRSTVLLCSTRRWRSAGSLDLEAARGADRVPEAGPAGRAERRSPLARAPRPQDCRVAHRVVGPPTPPPTAVLEPAPASWGGWPPARHRAAVRRCP
jgi:hypothetical protein